MCSVSCLLYALNVREAGCLPAPLLDEMSNCVRKSDGVTSVWSCKWLRTRYESSSQEDSVSETAGELGIINRRTRKKVICFKI